MRHLPSKIKKRAQRDLDKIENNKCDIQKSVTKNQFIVRSILQ